MNTESLIRVGFCQPKFYKPHVWKKAKAIMENLCEIPESGVSRFDFGRGKGKYTFQDDKPLDKLIPTWLNLLRNTGKNK